MDSNERSGYIKAHITDWFRTMGFLRLGAFVPVGREPAIWSIVDAFSQQGQVYLPQYQPQEGGYGWSRYANALHPGRFHIPEPVVNDPLTEALDACLVPALGVDATGNRLGWGYGFFDRLLTDTIPHRIGVIFDAQRLPNSLPTDPWDVRLTGIVTESGLHHFQ